MENIRLTPEYWKNIFNQINLDNPADFVPLDDWEFYAEQVWCMTEEGDITYAKCTKIAKSLNI